MTWIWACIIVIIIIIVCASTGRIYHTKSYPIRLHVRTHSLYNNNNNNNKWYAGEQPHGTLRTHCQLLALVRRVFNELRMMTYVTDLIVMLICITFEWHIIGVKPYVKTILLLYARLVANLVILVENRIKIDSCEIDTKNNIKISFPADAD